MMIYKELSEPFDYDLIKWRVGAKSGDKKSGLALAYVDARDIMQRLDKVVGWDGWSNKTTKQGDTYICELAVNGVVKTDGAGGTDVEAEKGGVSDALKRAAVLFGVGRYLYYTPPTWVAIKPQGKSFVIDWNANTVTKLKAAHQGAILAYSAAALAKPSNVAKPATIKERDAKVRKALEAATTLEQVLSVEGKCEDLIGDMYASEHEVNHEYADQLVQLIDDKKQELDPLNK